MIKIYRNQARMGQIIPDIPGKCMQIHMAGLRWVWHAEDRRQAVAAALGKNVGASGQGAELIRQQPARDFPSGGGPSTDVLGYALPGGPATVSMHLAREVQHTSKSNVSENTRYPREMHADTHGRLMVGMACRRSTTSCGGRPWEERWRVRTGS